MHLYQERQSVHWLRSPGQIETKYDYFKEKISTTEDFITYAATKSVMNGKPYRVLCSGKEINLADWLQAELNNLRTR